MPIVEAHLMHNAHLLATLKTKCFYSYGDGATRESQLAMVYHENESISEEKETKESKSSDESSYKCCTKFWWQQFSV